ncbi:GntR family transcriptional regulator [Luedemannella helvata]|uniref:HTH gntR-type domain-containing protein n=1 Tax=Luedemannella helvata TaxID=349315 RepID=A0ABN2L855_9ACTN
MHPADDKRVLFQRVVDDIVDQIRTGTLQPDDVLPTARKMAEQYGIASMTAQRALRELQTLGLTYGVVGRGTFVHPQAPERVRILDGEPVPEPPRKTIPDPDLDARLARYLLKRDEMTAKTIALIEGGPDKTTRDRLLAELAELHAELDAMAQPLRDEIAQYHARLATAAGPDTEPTTATTTEPPRPRRARQPRS